MAVAFPVGAPERLALARRTPVRLDCDRTGPMSRGTTSQRGYGPKHQALRALAALDVATGNVPCARCGIHIQPGEPWDLGHDDQDRTKYSGPEHRRCNRATNGRRITDPAPIPRIKW